MKARYTPGSPIVVELFVPSSVTLYYMFASTMEFTLYYVTIWLIVSMLNGEVFEERMVSNLPKSDINTGT